MDRNDLVKIKVAELRDYYQPTTKADNEFMTRIERLIEAWYEDGIPQEKIDEYIETLKGKDVN